MALFLYRRRPAKQPFRRPAAGQAFFKRYGFYQIPAQRETLSNHFGCHAAHARSSSRGVNPSQHSYLPELVDTPVGFRVINPA